MEKSKNEIEYANYVALAGYVQSVKTHEESAFVLIDVTGDKNGGPTKWIPLTCYKEPAIVQRLERYGRGDKLKVRGYVRAWSQKKDGEWRNAVDIRITEILSKDPESRKTRPMETRRREPGDDDIPW